MNKVLYAREGAKSIMDRTFADLPWQIRVEVDGVEIEVPEVSHLSMNNLYFGSHHSFWYNCLDYKLLFFHK